MNVSHPRNVSDLVHVQACITKNETSTNNTGHRVNERLHPRSSNLCTRDGLRLCVLFMFSLSLSRLYDIPQPWTEHSVGLVPGGRFGREREQRGDEIVAALTKALDIDALRAAIVREGDGDEAGSAVKGSAGAFGFMTSTANRLMIANNSSEALRRSSTSARRASSWAQFRITLHSPSHATGEHP